MAELTNRNAIGLEKLSGVFGGTSKDAFFVGCLPNFVTEVSQ
ncbi:MAG: hypothetical protein AAFR12_23070 [Cyanobacteria bacterium J06626_6]